ncbi:MAG: type II toxin-antitoxin system RelE/ParE family toxin, partial [Candidatus Dormibacteria bacterium]
MRVELSPTAKADLLEVVDYIARDNPERAGCFVDELESQCDRLEALPGIGTPRPDVLEGLLSIPYQRYVLFY